MHLASMVGYQATVIAHQSEFAQTEHFPIAVVRLINDFNRAFDHLDIGTEAPEEIAIIIFTEMIQEHARLYK